MPYLGTSPSSGLAGADLNGQSLILDADADTHITADTDDQIDISIAGADDFQFTANTFTAQSGSTIAAQAVTATAVTSSGVVLGPAGSVSAPAFSFSGDTDSGMYSIGADELGIAVGGLTPIHATNRKVYINDSAGAGTTSGLIINQTSYDDNILELKNSDVAHGLTDVCETDTYTSFGKNNGTTGGMLINTINDNSASVMPVIKFRQFSYHTTTTKTTDGEGQFEIQGAKHDNANAITNMSTNQNVLSIRARISGAYRTVFIVDADGDYHYDGADGGAFDNYDDALLCRSFDLGRGAKGIVKGAWDKFATENTKALTDAGILGEVDPDNPEHYNELGELGKPLVNAAQLQRLHNGAIWQQRAMFETLKEVAEELLPGFANKLNERLESKNLPTLPV